jgi:hypothetical protein
MRRSVLVKKKSAVSKFTLLHEALPMEHPRLGAEPSLAPLIATSNDQARPSSSSIGATNIANKKWKTTAKQSKVPLELKLQRCVGERTYVPVISNSVRVPKMRCAQNGNAMRTV